MLDMGPYYVTAMVNLLGSVTWTTSMSRITYPERTITSEPHRGEVIKVDVPTHVAGIMEFENGAIGTLLTSFDIYPTECRNFIEVYGTEGTMYRMDLSRVLKKSAVLPPSYFAKFLFSEIIAAFCASLSKSRLKRVTDP